MRTNDDVVGIDTNILVYVEDPLSPHHPIARTILEEAFTGKRKLCLSHQVLAEYYAVITNPRRVGNPLTADEATRRVLFLSRTKKIRKIYPKRLTLNRCIRHCQEKDITAAKIFDIYYAMNLLDNGVKTLMTHNPKDFISFANLGLSTQDPFTEHTEQ